MHSSDRKSALFVLIAALALGVPQRASAQSSAEPPDVSGFRTFATWPDDAQVLDPGSGLLSIGVSQWRWAFGSGVGVPSLFGAIGIAPHVQLGASFESDASRYSDGTRQTSVGDTYIVSKVTLVDSAKQRIGIAVSPLLQILGTDSITYYRYYKSAETSRMQWALPVHVQVPVGSVSLSASAGIFSVGSRFLSATVDIPVNARLSLTGTLSRSYSTDSGSLTQNIGVSRRRNDASGGASIVLSPAAVVFGTIGRTISTADQNSMTLSANFGVAVFFSHRH